MVGVSFTGWLMTALRCYSPQEERESANPALHICHYAFSILDRPGALMKRKCHHICKFPWMPLLFLLFLYIFFFFFRYGGCARGDWCILMRKKHRIALIVTPFWPQSPSSVPINPHQSRSHGRLANREPSVMCGWCVCGFCLKGMAGAVKVVYGSAVCD